MRNCLTDYEFTQEVSAEYFTYMTDWLLNWHRRDSSMTFSVVLIDFNEPAALGNALGAAYAMDLIRRLGREVASNLRSTDLLCRVRASTFWVLLPQGAPSIVLNKIEPILAAAREDGLAASQLLIGKISVPEDMHANITALELFDRIRK